VGVTGVPPIHWINRPTFQQVVQIGNDGDLDGCDDLRETGSDPTLGGMRDPQNFWDFFDTPDAVNIRDKAVAGTDFFRVLQRFGAGGNANLDPRSKPPAFDRGPASGPNAWNVTAADGTIAGTDFFAMLSQFGHTCA
jgi:hypothetical protein